MTWFIEVKSIAHIHMLLLAYIHPLSSCKKQHGEKTNEDPRSLFVFYWSLTLSRLLFHLSPNLERPCTTSGGLIVVTLWLWLGTCMGLLVVELTNSPQLTYFSVPGSKGAGRSRGSCELVYHSFCR